jgi:uncharacterized protein (TIGR03435 family)
MLPAHSILSFVWMLFGWMVIWIECIPASAQSPTLAPRFETSRVLAAAIDPRIQPCLCEPPGRVAYRTAPLKWIVERAFGLQDSQIRGPGWMDAESFTIDATLPEDASKEQIPAMLQKLLEEKFGLTAHRESKEAMLLILKPAAGGAKFAHPESNRETGWRGDRSGIHVRQRTNMDDFAFYLSGQLGRTVLNETGLAGIYAVELDFAPDNLPSQTDRATELAPALPVALEHQLGLKLEQRTGPVEILVIDHVEKIPAEN